MDMSMPGSKMRMIAGALCALSAGGALAGFTAASADSGNNALDSTVRAAMPPIDTRALTAKAQEAAPEETQSEKEAQRLEALELAKAKLRRENEAQIQEMSAPAAEEEMPVEETMTQEAAFQEAVEEQAPAQEAAVEEAPIEDVNAAQAPDVMLPAEAEPVEGPADTGGVEAPVTIIPAPEPAVQDPAAADPTQVATAPEVPAEQPSVDENANVTEIPPEDIANPGQAIPEPEVPIEQPAPEVPVDQPAEQPAQEVPTQDPAAANYTDLNNRIAEAAKALVGTTNGMQCTEVVQLALANAGVADAANLWPREYAGVFGYYTDNPQPGNIIYYNKGGDGLDHVAIYIGNGLAVHGNYQINGTSITTIASVEIPDCTSYGFIQVVR